jgi:ATP-binding cassette subfamily F protein 3
MDMRSKDILKSALLRYDGTLIVVSHDREFLDGLVNKVYEFRDGKVKEHLGDIWDFLQRRKLESMRELEAQAPPAAQKKEPAGKADARQEASYTDKREKDRQLRRQQKQREELEKQIERCDAELAEMDALLAENPTKATLEFFEKYNNLKKRQDDLMWKWSEAM